jgi:aspartate carbamoyltransferase catalytic subunit
LRRGEGDLAGLTVTIVGDILHSRVARSNVHLLKTLGAKVRLVAPPTLLPIGADTWGVETTYNLDEALEGADAVMMLRIQQERMNAAYFPTIHEYSQRYGLNQTRVNRMNDGAIVMHPGPMNRGVEISSEVADGTQSVIVEQVANGVSVRMAVLYLMLGGSEA